MNDELLSYLHWTPKFGFNVFSFHPNLLEYRATHDIAFLIRGLVSLVRFITPPLFDITATAVVNGLTLPFPLAEADAEKGTRSSVPRCIS